ncbi:MAG: virulence factor family protein [Pseudonocardiales bacterium]|nr:virulence factor family protein [Pseudonocardiales bacterium]
MSGSARRLIHAAALLAVITALARIAGFGRTTAFGRGVGSGCVGSVYQTANYVPNIIFDIVAGGMLSALVVPILAPAIASGDRDRVDQMLSALINWALVILLPVAVLVAVAAGPIMSALLGPQDECSGAHALGTRMLLVFAPQIVFYGLGVVLGGLLAASERFTWPAVAPLLSSFVVIGAYLAYGAMAGPGLDPRGLPRNAEIVLTVGTTAGVVVLAGCLIPPALRTGARWRPTLRFPADIVRTVRLAAGVGAATLAAQELSTAVMIRLANSGTERGTLVIVTMAQTLFLLPWAVLSLPVATTAFPRLSSDWAGGLRESYARRVAASGSIIITAAAAGTAVLIAVAEPAGIVLLGPHAPSLRAFAPTAVAFAIGLLGWSLVALLGRALYASGHLVSSARAQVAGQLTVIAVDVVLSFLVGSVHRAVVLGIGNSVGVLMAAALLIIDGHRIGAFSARSWANRSSVAAVIAGVVGAGAGALVGRQAHGDATLAGLGWGVAAATVAAALFVAVVLLMDRAALQAVFHRGRR